MTAQNPLDHHGSFADHPLPELFAEIRQNAFGGSLRLARGEAKAVVYFNDGEVVFAVSNRREHRLLQMLIDRNKVQAHQLAGLPKFGNDVELAAMLVNEQVLRQEDIDAVIAAQIEKIIADTLAWPDGEWQFSPLVRSRSDLAYSVNISPMLAEYGRAQKISAVLTRFGSMKERFQRLPEARAGFELHSHEDFVLQRFSAEPRDIDGLTLECGLPENGFLQALYVLWLGGLVERSNWNAAFSEQKVEAIRKARMQVVKPAQKAAPAAPAAAPDEPAEAEPKPEEKAAPAREFTLEEYLAHVEAARTHYDVLSVDTKAGVAEIKTSFFMLAKLFHPDRFHREAPAMLQRIQAAFSSVQVAYDTLKSAEARENYDFKVRKELEMREKLRAQGVEETEKIDAKVEQGLENFEVGLSLLLDEEYERAIPFLGRAAHYNPDNALYRSYYGKALSYDEKQRHKAEAEMQAAIKLDPRNPKIRMMLVEFFVENQLIKRAEGELKRFLALVPNNAEARDLLEKLQN